MPSFIDAYNGKFAKIPRNTHDAHRRLPPQEDLDLIFAWRELRKVSQNLLLHYERKLYVLVDTAGNSGNGLDSLAPRARHQPARGAQAAH